MFVIFASTCVKIPLKAFRIFRAGLCDPARLLTNQIACFIVVII